MNQFDVFNGDADGLCALHQLRLADPRPAQLVTGLKRDNALLARVPAAAGDSVTVLDISMATNRDALVSLLERGVTIRYFDHHHAADLPVHPRLSAVIDTAPEVCTSVLVDRSLGGLHRPWAVVGAFGDAIHATGRALAATLGLDHGATDALRHLGECLNYNSYGDTPADQIISPEDLYRRISPYTHPLDFMAKESIYDDLARQYRQDLELALAVLPLSQEGDARVYLLPDAPWARRIVGNFAHALVTNGPGQAYAVLVPGASGKLTVSLRVPAGAATTADRFARRHGGNGRVTAAGIGNLPPDAVEGLVEDFSAVYRRQDRPA